MPGASAAARPGTPRRLLLAALALALSLSGCGPAPDGAAPDAPPPPGPLPAAPAPAPQDDAQDDAPDAAQDGDAREPDLAPRPDPAPDTTAPDGCPDATRDAIATTVGTQLDAFALEDFAAAYAMTSPYFRLVFATDDFEEMIRTDYPELVGNRGHRFDDCQVRNRRAFIVVGVRAGSPSDSGEIVLRYDLSEEPDGWRIDGAGLLPGIALPPEQLV